VNNGSTFCRTAAVHFSLQASHWIKVNDNLRSRIVCTSQAVPHWWHCETTSSVILFASGDQNKVFTYICSLDFLPYLFGN
jgi:hypothetical protein